MKKLLKQIQALKDSPVRARIDQRIQEFKQNRDIFSELCFCLLTANFQAEKSIRIQEEVGEDFHMLPESELAGKLKQLGHRFPNTRANFICKARSKKAELNHALETLRGSELRDWLVKNIKGLGYKEASHLLRNIGYDNYAIIDFHIIELLVKHKLIKKPKSLTPKKYLEIETALKNLATQAKLTLGELDLYLWYLETKKVLK